MEAKDRLILALDTDCKTAKYTMRTLGDSIGMYKANSLFVEDAFVSSDFLSRSSAVDELLTGHNLFLDLKFYDIPNTVTNYAKVIIKNPLVKMFTIHASGGREMMTKCMEVVKSAGEKRPKVVAVTVLTSMSEKVFQEMNCDIISSRLEDHVRNLARLAKESGVDGVVCSPKEIQIVREACGKDFLIVTPGIRPSWSAVGDQKRVTTPKEAIQMGADYIVVGRPILDAPDMKEAVERIVKEINCPYMAPGVYCKEKVEEK